MFKSYEYTKCLGYNKDADQYIYEYKLTDTDFVEEVTVTNPVWEEAWGARAIIDCYTKRGLPVAKNLFRHMLQLRDQYNWSLDEQVRQHKSHNSKWKEVEQDMKLYLTFS
jgi:hypothetical protein